VGVRVVARLHGVLAVADTLVRRRSPTAPPERPPVQFLEGQNVGSVIKKRRKRMAKKKHRKLLKRTRVQRRRLGK
jgi:hypothetical protein